MLIAHHLISLVHHIQYYIFLDSSPCLCLPQNRLLLMKLFHNVSLGTKTYFGWCILIFVGLAPVFFSSLRPLWRVITTVVPTLLAIDVDAGNHTSIYIAKFIIWILSCIYSILALWFTNGFRKKSPYPLYWQLLLACILFLASCITTYIGFRKKDTIWMKRQSKIKSKNLYPIDHTSYADMSSNSVRTPLMPHEVAMNNFERNAPLKQNKTPTLLNDDEIATTIRKTSLVSEYVRRHTFKSHQNKIYVFSYVTKYRSLVLILAFVGAGLINFGLKLFKSKDDRPIIQSLILWLTLPSITLPNILRLKFGPNARPMLLKQGFLPVETDLDMSRRLGISQFGLFTALTNCFRSKAIFSCKNCAKIMLQDRPGIGSVNPIDSSKASNLSGRSLLRQGKFYVRIADGMRFKRNERGIEPISMRKPQIKKDTKRKRKIPQRFHPSKPQLRQSYHTQEMQGHDDEIIIPLPLPQKRFCEVEPWQLSDDEHDHKNSKHDDDGMTTAWGILEDHFQFEEYKFDDTKKSDDDVDNEEQESLKENHSKQILLELAKEFGREEIDWKTYDRLHKEVLHNMSRTKAMEMFGRISNRVLTKTGPLLATAAGLLVLGAQNDEDTNEYGQNVEEGQEEFGLDQFDDGPSDEYGEDDVYDDIDDFEDDYDYGMDGFN